MAWMNKLYFGDNLKILRDYVAPETVDLIYLDPPFNSSATHTFSVAPPFRAAHARLKPGATPSGEESAAQIMAFADIRQPTDSGAWNPRQCRRKSSPAARASSPT